MTAEERAELAEAAYRAVKAELEEIRAVAREFVEHWGPHCGGCCAWEPGTTGIVITKESCICGDLNKRVRQALKMEPWDEG